MVTDRELLELAAKAAGLTIDRSFYSGAGGNNTGFDISGNAVLDWHNGATWNPRARSGDALDLSAKLKIDIKHYDDHVVAWYDGGYIGTGMIPCGDDRNDAMRLAIVMAAAEIGKDMLAASKGNADA